jgi:phage regulator Rha-like protein
LRFQIGTSSYGGRRYLPYAFTEHGVAMLSSVLNSRKAIQVNLAIIRSFIKLRELLATHKDLILEIEKIKREQKNQNQKIISIMSVINQMLNPPVDDKKEPIGFRDRSKDKK